MKQTKHKLLILKLDKALDCLVAEENDFEDLLRKSTSFEKQDCIVISPAQEQPFPDLQQFHGVILTGSTAMLTAPPEWNKRLMDWVEALMRTQIPILGICYGHQVLGQILGAKVDWNTKGRELGSQAVTLTEAGQDDALYKGLPKQLQVLAIHSQSLLSLPNKAKLLAYNAHDAVQSFVWNDRVWGTQFHPEFTNHVMQTYFDEHAEKFLQEGFDLTTLRNNLVNSDHGKQLLQNFADIIKSNH